LKQTLIKYISTMFTVHWASYFLTVLHT